MDILLNTVAVVILLLGVLFVFTLAFAYTRKSNQPLQHSDKFDDLYMKLSQEIKFAVAPKSLQISVVANELVELATEIWRIELRLAKVANSLPEIHKRGLENSMLKLKKYISNYDVEIIDYTNQKFNDGLNLDVLSIEKDPAVTTSTVKETVEPTIMVKGQVVKKAKIILLSN